LVIKGFSKESGVQIPAGKKFFSPPDQPARIWGPPSLLFNGEQIISRR